MLAKRTNVGTEHLFRDNAMREQKVIALCDLAVWSNPAWLNHRSPMSTIAAIQWVMYHRTWYHLNKVTVAQFIGSVKGVIPSSKLAKYGDYSYNTEYEDMYLTTEEVTFQCEKTEVDVNSNLQTSFDTHSIVSEESHSRREKEAEQKRIKKWLKKVKNALDGVIRTTNGGQLVDTKTNAFLKLCLRFISTAGTNDALIDTLNSEIDFIDDHGQPQKTPISRIELQSIPHPASEEDLSLDCDLVDALCLKLSSAEIQKLWKEDDAKTLFPFSVEDAFNDPFIPLMKINFLRRSHQKNKLSDDEEIIDIPEKLQMALLGSLLDAIEDLPLPPSTISKDAKHTQSNVSRAHGEWTEQLFVLGTEPDNPSGREVGANACSKTRTSDASVESENLFFYKPVPPPPSREFAMHMSPPARFLHPLDCQHRKSVMSMPIKNATFSHMTPQVQPMFPTVPAMYISSSAQDPNFAPQTIWNNTFSPRLSPSVQIARTDQYSKAAVPDAISRQHHPNDVTNVQKNFSRNVEAHFNLKNSLQQMEERLRNDKNMDEGVGNRFPYEIPWPVNKPVAQRRGRHSNDKYQPIVYENRVQHATSNIYGIKFPNLSQLCTSQLQAAKKINYSPMSYVRRPQIIFRTFPSRNGMVTQFTHKPGSTAITDIKRVQDKRKIDGFKCEEMDNRYVRKDTSTERMLPNEKEEGLGNKVEKWLQTVNQYTTSHPCRKMEFPETHGFGAGNDCGTSDVSEKGDSAEINKKAPNKYSTHGCVDLEAEASFKIYDFDDNPQQNIKKSKRNVRNLLPKYLRLFEISVRKLKKNRSLKNKIIKFITKHFAEIDNLNRIGSHLRIKIKILELTSRTLKAGCLDASRKSTNFREFRPESFSFPLGSFFDVLNENSFTNDVNGYDVVIRENREFNAFPSKRSKISGHREPLPRNVIVGSRARHIDSFVNGLFSPPTKRAGKSLNREVINGWTRFQMATKSALKNIVSSSRVNMKYRNNLSSNMNYFHQHPECK